MVCPSAYHAAAADQERLFGGADHFNELMHIVAVRLRGFKVMGSPLDECTEAPFRGMRFAG